jgi:hypothetical protein
MRQKEQVLGCAQLDEPGCLVFAGDALPTKHFDVSMKFLKKRLPQGMRDLRRSMTSDLERYQSDRNGLSEKLLANIER